MEANHTHLWPDEGTPAQVSGAFLYQHHRPEKTLSYQLVSKHYPSGRLTIKFQALRKLRPNLFNWHLFPFCDTL